MRMDEELAPATQVEVRPGEFKRLGDMTSTELLAAAELAQRRAEAHRMQAENLRQQALARARRDARSQPRPSPQPPQETS